MQDSIYECIIKNDIKMLIKAELKRINTKEIELNEIEQENVRFCNIIVATHAWSVSHYQKYLKIIKAIK